MMRSSVQEGRDSLSIQIVAPIQKARAKYHLQVPSQMAAVYCQHGAFSAAMHRIEAQAIMFLACQAIKVLHSDVQPWRADRLFWSIQDTWNSVMTLPTDVKELIPEFYSSDHLFLLNAEGVDFGERTSGKPIIFHQQLDGHLSDEKLQSQPIITVHPCDHC